MQWKVGLPVSTLKSVKPLNVADQVTGGLVGLLIGDSLGVPYEFKAAGHIPSLSQIEMTPPLGDSATWGQPAGTWSDDGAQALCLLDSLLYQEGRFDPVDFGNMLVGWYQAGYMASEGRVFDIGGQSKKAIDGLAKTAPGKKRKIRVKHDARGLEFESRGNGSVMRALPVALMGVALSDADLAQMAMAQAKVTHPGGACQLATAQYVLWARFIMAGLSPQFAWDAAYAHMQRVADTDEADRVLEELHRLRGVHPTGSGEVVDCVLSAYYAVEASTSYELAVRRAIAYGHDTDTTACVAGGIAGLQYGLEGIPVRWRRTLRDQETVLRMVNALRRYHGAEPLTSLY